jgi:hypothetical protein
MLKSIVVLSFPLLMGCVTTHAHAAPPPAAPIAVSVEWVWVVSSHKARPYRAHPNVKGHWYHPHHGKSYRDHTAGPPPSRPHTQAHWEAGHWVGHGHNRHWVQGRWN